MAYYGPGTSTDTLTSNGDGELATYQASSGGTYYSITPYIVGQTGDTHAEYTGDAGIQAAMTAANTAGASSSNPANVYVKPGSYTPTGGTLTFYDGVNLVAFAPTSYGMLLLEGTNAPIPASVIINGVTATITDCKLSISNIDFPDGSITLENSSVLFQGLLLSSLRADNDGGTNRSFADIRNCEITSLIFNGLGEISAQASFFTVELELYTAVQSQIEFLQCSFASGILFRINDSSTFTLFFLGCYFATGSTFNIVAGGTFITYFISCSFLDDSYASANATYYMFDCTDLSNSIVSQTSSSTGIGVVTSPTSSALANAALGSLSLGTALQNTTGYDVILIVYVNITVNTAGTLSCGVGPTSTPTADILIVGVTVLGIVPVTVYLPAGYYVLLSTDASMTASITGQQVTPV